MGGNVEATTFRPQHIFRPFTFQFGQRRIESNNYRHNVANRAINGQAYNQNLDPPQVYQQQVYQPVYQQPRGFQPQQPQNYFIDQTQQQQSFFQTQPEQQLQVAQQRVDQNFFQTQNQPVYTQRQPVAYTPLNQGQNRFDLLNRQNNNYFQG